MNITNLDEMDVAKALIKNGAKINAKDVSGRSPIHTAASRGKCRILK